MKALQFEICADRSSISMSIWSNKLGGSLSNSTNFDAKQVPVFTATRIEGGLAIEPKKLGDTAYQYNVKFAADFQPRVVAAPLRAADTAAAAKAPPTAAYLAWAAAVKAGKKAKMLELASPDVRKMIDQPGFAEKLAFVQAMAPSAVKGLKATETGDEARLEVSGTQKGKTVRGTITMMWQAGKWLLIKESWKAGE